MNTVVYLRISQDRAGDEAGVARQREDCERRCRDRGWSVVAIDQDNDKSASTGRRRPGFEAMLRRIERGEVQVVVAWALDRLQRNRRDELRLYEACRRYGVLVSLVRGPDLEWETPAGRYLADNLGSIARLEVEMKSDRQRRAVMQAAREGRRVGGRRPFGYSSDGMRLRKREAAAVEQGFVMLLAGVSLAEIARTWNTAGLRTGQKGLKPETRDQLGLWRSDTVRGVLLNPRYAGLRGHGSVPDHGRRTVEVTGPARWPAVVSEETWRAVGAILTDPGRRNAPTSAQALLTDLAKCGVCGGGVHGGRVTKAGMDSTGARTYRCRGDVGRIHFARRAAPVDAWVGMLAIDRLGRPDAAELLVDCQRPDVEELRGEARTLRKRRTQLAEAFAEGGIDLVQLTAGTARLDAKIAAVETRMADAGRVDLLGPLVSAEDVEAAWDGLSTQRQRAVLAVLAARITLQPIGRGRRAVHPETMRETVAIEWRTT